MGQSGRYLADARQLGQQHLEDGRRQRLLQHLQELLRLPAHGDGVGQVVHAPLIVSWRRKATTVRTPQHKGHKQSKGGPYPEPEAPPPAGSPPGRTSAPPRRPSGPAAAAQDTLMTRPQNLRCATPTPFTQNSREPGAQTSRTRAGASPRPRSSGRVRTGLNAWNHVC